MQKRSTSRIIARDRRHATLRVIARDKGLAAMQTSMIQYVKHLNNHS
jgi:hypothetical protein